MPSWRLENGFIPVSSHCRRVLVPACTSARVSAFRGVMFHKRQRAGERGNPTSRAPVPKCAPNDSLRDEAIHGVANGSMDWFAAPVIRRRIATTAVTRNDAWPTVMATGRLSSRLSPGKRSDKLCFAPKTSGVAVDAFRSFRRSEEHTSELQSLRHLVCRLL